MPGSPSGGRVEGAVYSLALRALGSGEAQRVTFGYSDSDAFAVGLSCRRPPRPAGAPCRRRNVVGRASADLTRDRAHRGVRAPMPAGRRPRGAFQKAPIRCSPIRASKAAGFVKRPTSPTELRIHGGRHYAARFPYALPDDAWCVELSEAVPAPAARREIPDAAAHLPGAPFRGAAPARQPRAGQRPGHHRQAPTRRERRRNPTGRPLRPPRARHRPAALSPLAAPDLLAGAGHERDQHQAPPRPHPRGDRAARRRGRALVLHPARLPSDGRHRAVTGGLPVHIAARILGHRTPTTTQAYLAVFQDDMVRTYAAFRTGAGLTGPRRSTASPPSRSGATSSGTSGYARFPWHLWTALRHSPQARTHLHPLPCPPNRPPPTGPPHRDHPEPPRTHPRSSRQRLARRGRRIPGQSRRRHGRAQQPQPGPGRRPTPTGRPRHARLHRPTRHSHTPRRVPACTRGARSRSAARTSPGAPGRQADPDSR
ncbi:hypothetical protein [Streptomyces flaveolus]|uniref:hypothetical protein n=1 Tax=Streptomyces flaveolus TaxID=67297 RepID=UPI003F540E60